MNTSFNIRQFAMIVLAAAGLMLSAAPAVAAEENGATVNHQNPAKRPYQSVKEQPAHEANDAFEGATMIKQEDRAEKLPSLRHQRQINNLGKQPYQGSVD
jgi:spermidine/putrescine-binding protein